MIDNTILESARELAVIAGGVLFAKAVEYVGVKLFKKIDDMNETWLD